MNNSNTTPKSPTKKAVKVPKPILLTGKLLQLTSSTLTTKFAVKLFKTPIKFNTPQLEKTMEKDSQKELIFIPEIKKKVMVYNYGSSKRKILLVHGWSGRGTQLFGIADKLIENGFMTISFDAPAHGKSSSKTTMMPEFIAVAKHLEKELGPFEYAIGHSLGAMAVLNAIKQGLNVKKAVVIGAGDVITDIIKSFVKKLQLKPKLVLKMKEHFFTKFGEDIDIYSGSVAAKDVKIPTLVIHDTEDTEVPVSCSHNIHKNLVLSEIMITTGLGHTRILKNSDVIQKIELFITKNKESSN